MRTVGGQAKGLGQKETVKGCVEEDTGVQLGLEKCCGSLGKGREGSLRGGGGVTGFYPYPVFLCLGK